MGQAAYRRLFGDAINGIEELCALQDLIDAQLRTLDRRSVTQPRLILIRKAPRILTKRSGLLRTRAVGETQRSQKEFRPVRKTTLEIVELCRLTLQSSPVAGIDRSQFARRHALLEF